MRSWPSGTRVFARLPLGSRCPKDERRSRALEKLRVLIADDHPLFRDGMRGLLSTQPDIEVAGEATTGEEAVKLSGELEPDVVLMDVKMPGLGGIEATRRVLAANPRIRVLVVTMFEDDATVFTAMRAGARGYVLKDDEKDDVLGAIRAVGRGGAVFGPSVAARLADFFATTVPLSPEKRSLLSPTASVRCCTSWRRVPPTPKSPGSCP